jgi:hypothetical protein
MLPFFQSKQTTATHTPNNSDSEEADFLKDPSNGNISSIREQLLSNHQYLSQHISTDSTEKP